MSLDACQTHFLRCSRISDGPTAGLSARGNPRKSHESIDRGLIRMPTSLSPSVGQRTVTISGVSETSMTPYGAAEKTGFRRRSERNAHHGESQAKKTGPTVAVLLATRRPAIHDQRARSNRLAHPPSTPYDE